MGQTLDTHAPRSKTSAANGRIVITGTGRAGTTFLVQLFSALGFDTGFSPDDAMSRVDGISQAGLETALVADDNPYVIKSPWFADGLMDALERKQIEIYTAIVPVRDLFEAAESRRRVFFESMKKGKNPTSHPGSLWHTRRPKDQENSLTHQFYKSVFPLVKFDIPIILLSFPRLVRDPDYLFGRLRAMLDAHGVGHAEFLVAFTKVVRPDAVHTFENRPDNTAPGGSGVFVRIFLIRLGDKLLRIFRAAQLLTKSRATEPELE